MKFKRIKNLANGMVEAPDLASVPDQIEMLGGERVQLIDHRAKDTAETLSDVIAKMRAKGNAVGKLVSSPVGKRAALALGGPAMMALSTAQDAMASEDVGLGSDQVDNLQNEEALMNVPHENFADPEVSEQARRWQKIRGIMEK